MTQSVGILAEAERRAPDNSSLELSLDAFIRTININKTLSHGIFLGAGASFSSGVPTANLCIWEWKREIFLTNNPGLKDQFSELSLKSVKDRIQDWLDRQGGYPTKDSPEEYQFYIERCFPISDSRRAYFQEHVRKAEPFIGYKLLCLMAEQGIFNTVFSTNFDGLVSRAAANFKITPIEVGMDSQERLHRNTNNNEILCISLHGDYRYDPIKNTADELKRQEALFAKKLIEFSKKNPLIVIGYSGRDDSIMETLTAAYSQEGSGSLFWCGREGKEIPANIKTLLETARSHGHNAHYVRTSGFDDTLERLALHCLENAPLSEANKLISAMNKQQDKPRSAFSPITGTPTSIIKSNAFELEVPSEILQCGLVSWPSEGRWNWLKDKIKGKSVVAAPFGDKVLFWGAADDAKSIFGDNTKLPVERSPISGKDLHRDEGVIISLIRQVLVKSLGSTASLHHDDNKEIWLSSVRSSFTHEGITYKCHDSVIVYVKNISGRMHVVLMPSVRIINNQGELAPSEISKIKKNELLSGQYNKQFNATINEWRQRLLPGSGAWMQYEYPAGSASPFIFRIRKSPLFAQIDSKESNVRAIPIDDKIRPLIKHKGIEIKEPQLLFSNSAANNTVRDAHPIRGIVSAKPFDYGLTTAGLMPKIKIGVICPHGESTKLSPKLQAIKNRHRPNDKERDYLMDYPGFDVAFGIPIDLPSYGDAGWQECLSPSSSDPTTASLEAAQSIIKSLDTMLAIQRPSVIIILIPSKWKNFRGFRSDVERFDLHDFVKAYAVQKGIATQFIEEDTFLNPSPCRVWWWLSLALYAKSMRTPWVLDGMDMDTAYVGLGFSIDHTAAKNQKVTLGCSHIYNHQGQGLQYRLTKLENPLIRGRNAFMSLEDARRQGEKIRELFFETRRRLPSRVVLHKNTPFLKDEQTGLLEGLSGVNQVEMVQVGIDHSLRYVSSFYSRNGIQEGLFPVNRGTAVRLDDFSALVWVHGSTRIMDDNKTYYQGKRRIPAPLKIKKFSGQSDLDALVREIMGLSKMDWNSFDLYTQLPATVQSSSQIARIGALLERFDNTSYDYRLFM